MKKLKVLRAVFEVDLSEDLEVNTQLILDEVIKISDIVVLDNSYSDSKTTMCEVLLNKEISYVSAEEIEPNNDRFLKDDIIKCRMATQEEEDLIYKYIKDKHSKIKVFECEEPYLDLIVFDISNTNKLVHNNLCSVVTYTNGKKEVQHFIEKYNIRHGFVYDLENEEEILDYDEDISSIQSLL